MKEIEGFDGDVRTSLSIPASISKARDRLIFPSANGNELYRIDLVKKRRLDSINSATGKVLHAAFTGDGEILFIEEDAEDNCYFVRWDEDQKKPPYRTAISRFAPSRADRPEEAFDHQIG